MVDIVTDLKVSIDGKTFDGRDQGIQLIMKEGLEDWWDPPETTNAETRIPGRHGAQTPVAMTLGPRRVRFRALVDAASVGVAEADFRAWAAALALNDNIPFGVAVDGEWKYLRNASVRGRARVRPYRYDMSMTDIDMILWSPDPFKYGAIASTTFTADGATDQVVSIANPGTAPMYPWFKIDGPAEGVLVTSPLGDVEILQTIASGSTATFSPYAGGRLTIDGADASGGLIRSEWQPIHGESTGVYTFDGASMQSGAVVTIFNYEGAWV